jgi:PadR family transcriptional regulator, regulatory protein AphA
MSLRHVVLTVLARGGLSGYEITKNFEAVYSHFWRASHQQVYRELARLRAAGYLTAKVVTQEGRPNKNVYALTKQGLDELRKWVGESTEFPKPQNDLLVKLLALGVADPRAFRLEFDRVVKDAHEWLAKLRALQRECLRTRKSWSEHDEVLYLALRRGLLVGEAQSRWLAEVDVYLRKRKG